jgi:hypothetical protein
MLAAVHKAMQALGGILAPRARRGACGGSAAERPQVGDPARLGRRPVRQEQAQGILVAALGVLAARLAVATQLEVMHRNAASPLLCYAVGDGGSRPCVC